MLIFGLLETGEGRGWLFAICLLLKKVKKMSIIFFGSKFDFLAIKSDAHFLTNETIFGIRGGEGAAI